MTTEKQNTDPEQVEVDGVATSSMSREEVYKQAEALLDEAYDLCATHKIGCALLLAQDKNTFHSSICNEVADDSIKGALLVAHRYSQYSDELLEAAIEDMVKEQ